MISIRKATKNDVESIILLWNKLMRMHSHMGLFKLSDDADTHYGKELMKWIEGESSFVFVAESADEFVAYVTGWTVNVPLVFKDRSRAYINDMWVDEEYRKKGVGKMIIDKVKEHCKGKGITIIDLSVAVDNERGIKFWKSQGFNPETHRMVYYSNQA